MSPTSLIVAPVEALAGRDTLVPAESQPRPLPRRILLADDDADLRQLCSGVLMHSGYQVDTAEDGEAAWTVLQTGCRGYDLLITDHNMPKLTGVGLVNKVRSAGMTLPVILVSGAAPLNTEWLALAAVLSKPFAPRQLVRTVKEVLHTDPLVEPQLCHPQATH